MTLAELLASQGATPYSSMGAMTHNVNPYGQAYAVDAEGTGAYPGMTYDPNVDNWGNALYGTGGKISGTNGTPYGTVDIGGTTFRQMSDAPGMWTDGWQSFGPDPQYHPQYGWIWPEESAGNRAIDLNSQDDPFTKFLDAGGGVFALGAPILGAAFGMGPLSGASTLPGSGTSIFGNSLSGLFGGGESWGVNPSGAGAFDGATAGAGAGGGIDVAGGIGAGAFGAGSGTSVAGAGGLSGALGSIFPSDTGGWLGLAGKLAPAVLGAFGANAQTDAYRDVANQYLGLGAPYRSLLQSSYQPGFSLENEPGYQQALQTAQDTFLRAASAGRASGVSRGNPLDQNNPGAWAETQKYVMGSTLLPYLQNYRNTLASAGGLGVSQSAPAALGGAQASGGIYDAIGYGLGQILNPQQNSGQPDYSRLWMNNGGLV